MASTVEGFLASYRRAFEQLDAESVVELFTFPCQLVADGDEVTVSVVTDRAEWRQQMRRLVATYRRLGVRSASSDEVRIVELSPRVATLHVRWRLLDAEGGEIYAFGASYTVVDAGEGHRVAAIAHDELPRMRAALAAAGAGS